MTVGRVIVAAQTAHETHLEPMAFLAGQFPVADERLFSGPII
jgi:hypothetical protein